MQLKILSVNYRIPIVLRDQETLYHIQANLEIILGITKKEISKNIEYLIKIKLPV